MYRNRLSRLATLIFIFDHYYRKILIYKICKKDLEFIHAYPSSRKTPSSNVKKDYKPRKELISHDQRMPTRIKPTICIDQVLHRDLQHLRRRQLALRPVSLAHDIADCQTLTHRGL